MVGARWCCITVGRRFFQIRSLENYPVEGDRKVPTGMALLVKATARFYAKLDHLYIQPALMIAHLEEDVRVITQGRCSRAYALRETTTEEHDNGLSQVRRMREQDQR